MPREIFKIIYTEFCYFDASVSFGFLFVFKDTTDMSLVQEADINHLCLEGRYHGRMIQTEQEGGKSEEFTTKYLPRLE